MVREGIPCYLKDHMKNPWEHWVVRDVLAYLELAKSAEAGMKRGLLLAVMNRPARFFSRASLGTEEITFAQWKRFYQGKEWMRRRLDEFQKQLLRLRRLSGFAAVCYLRREMGYDDFLREYTKEHPGDSQWQERMEQLQELARGSVNISQLIRRVESLRDKIEEENRKQGEKEGLGLYTIHGAKGLEFSAVFLLGCNEGECPSKNVKSPAQIEEERRVFYVAVTRAKDRLYLSWVKEDVRGKKYPSRFLKEMREGSHQRISSNADSSKSSSKRSSTSSYSSSERMFSREGVPSSSSS